MSTIQPEGLQGPFPGSGQRNFIDIVLNMTRSENAHLKDFTVEYRIRRSFKFAIIKIWIPRFVLRSITVRSKMLNNGRPTNVEPNLPSNFLMAACDSSITIVMHTISYLSKKISFGIMEKWFRLPNIVRPFIFHKISSLTKISKFQRKFHFSSFVGISSLRKIESANNYDHAYVKYVNQEGKLEGIISVKKLLTTIDREKYWLVEVESNENPPISRAKSWLIKGYQVEIVISNRGVQKKKRILDRTIMDKILNELKDYSKEIHEPKWTGGAVILKMTGKGVDIEKIE
ncbi:13295_t:CDS:2 [Gigaspora rosea]|nr:13295_t:CDS:2 [Gigaspora rosea]